MKKKSNPLLEKREEQQHQDLDHDGEKGESSAHKKKVLGQTQAPIKMKRVGGNDTMPARKPKVPPMKGGKKMCPACVGSKRSSCSHQ